MARDKHLVLSVAQNPPYWSHCRFLREKIASGTLGEIEAVSINWLGNALGALGLEDLPQQMPGVVKPTLFRRSVHENGGGFLIDGGSHLLCELLWCTQLRVESVTAQMDDSGFDLRAALTLSLSNGALATLSQAANSHVRDKRHRSLYFGAAATAQVTGVPFEVEIQAPQADSAIESVHERDLPEAPTPVGDFIECVRGGCKEPELDNDLSVHIVEVIAAAYESAGSGKRVTC
jgi:predicted dehydrogenase